MRRALALLALAATAPAHAWEFTPGLPCLLTHSAPSAEVELTHDPTAPRYTISITAPVPWPQSPVFALRFDGPATRQIGTDRHTLSADGRTLTVADTGFGNVLDGLALNEVMTALIGDAAISVPLAGAAGPVAAFRACEADIPLS